MAIWLDPEAQMAKERLREERSRLKCQRQIAKLTRAPAVPEAPKAVAVLPEAPKPLAVLPEASFKAICAVAPPAEKPRASCPKAPAWWAPFWVGFLTGVGAVACGLALEKYL